MLAICCSSAMERIRSALPGKVRSYRSTILGCGIGPEYCSTCSTWRRNATTARRNSACFSCGMSWINSGEIGVFASNSAMSSGWSSMLLSSLTRVHSRRVLFRIRELPSAYCRQRIAMLREVHLPQMGLALDCDIWRVLSQSNRDPVSHGNQTGSLCRVILGASAR